MSTAKQRLARADDLYKLLTRLPGWEFGAAPACATSDPDLFLPEANEDRVHIAKAKALCADCPIKAPCLEFALRNREPGIWGGTSTRERALMRAAAAAAGADEQEAA